MTKKLRALLYARTSKEDAATDSLSIESQLELCRKYAEDKGYKIVGEYFDDGLSGTLGLPDRPGMLAAYDRAGAAERLIMAYEDRVSRDSLGPAQTIWTLFWEAGLPIETAENGLRDLENESDRMMIGFGGLISDAERLRIRRRTMTGAAKHARNGSFPHSRAPFGYVKVGTPKNYRLEPDPMEAPVVKRIFSLYAEKDISQNAIARLLTSEGIPSPGGTDWYKNTISVVLKRKAYIGTYEWRKTRSNMKHVRAAEAEEIILIPVPRLVSDSTFERVQGKLTDNKNHKRAEAKNPFPLRGRIRCLTCGRTYTRQSKTVEKTGKTYVYYQCTGSTNYRKVSGGRVCTEKVLKAIEVDPAIFRAVLKQIESPEYVSELLAGMNETSDSRNAGALDRIEAIDKAVLKAEKNLEKLLTSEATTQTQKTIDKVIAKSSETLERLTEEKRTLESSLVASPTVDPELIRSYWDTGNFNQVRTMLGEYSDFQDKEIDFLPDDSIRQLYEEINLRLEIGNESGTRKLYLSTDLTEGRADVTEECA